MVLNFSSRVSLSYLRIYCLYSSLPSVRKLPESAYNFNPLLCGCKSDNRRRATLVSSQSSFTEHLTFPEHRKLLPEKKFHHDHPEFINLLVGFSALAFSFLLKLIEKGFHSFQLDFNFLRMGSALKVELPKFVDFFVFLSIS